VLTDDDSIDYFDYFERLDSMICLFALTISDPCVKSAAEATGAATISVWKFAHIH